VAPSSKSAGDVGAGRLLSIARGRAGAGFGDLDEVHEPAAHLIRAGRDRFAYDDQGRLVRRRRALLSGGSHDWTYTWDAADRLTQVTTPDGSTWLYTYDPFGRRISEPPTPSDQVVAPARLG
jgi:YD repeat-containing protein